MNTNQPQETPFKGLTRSLFMEAIERTLNHRYNSYSNGYERKTKFSAIAIEKKEKLTKAEEDTIVDSYSDIIDPSYRVWFIKQLKRVGKSQFIECGEKARKYGKNPSKLFSDLLRN